jgi:hypothetical protein
MYRLVTSHPSALHCRRSASCKLSTVHPFMAFSVVASFPFQLLVFFFLYGCPSKASCFSVAVILVHCISLLASPDFCFSFIFLVMDTVASPSAQMAVGLGFLAQMVH